jgi:hypothetical protein
MADTEPVPMQAGKDDALDGTPGPVVLPANVPGTLRVATTDAMYRLADGNNGKDFPTITSEGTELTREQADLAFAAAEITARTNPGLALKEL